MPKKTNGRYRNKRYGNKRYTGSKTEVTYKHVPTISTLDKKIKKIQREVELKYNDTEVETQDIDQGGIAVLLNGIGIGPAEDDNRVGAEVQATSIQFRSVISTLPSNVTGPQYVRMLVFWDRQANGEVPIIIGDTEGSPSVLNNEVIEDQIFAPYRYETQMRYRILFDKTFIINPNFWQEYETTSSGEPDPVTNSVITNVYPYAIQVNKKIKLNRKVKYGSTVDGDEAIQTNSLWMAIFSSEPTNPPQFYGGFRFYYKDA